MEEEITKNVSNYEDKEDAAYGGYDGTLADYEKTVLDPHEDLKVHYLDDGSFINIH